ncbi:MAG TPA: hypothetical protein VGG70_08825 [Candidatus Cybelea sp.]
MNEDLVLVPEVEARRALRGRRIRMQMLVPIGPWIGCGKLRVLRLQVVSGETEEIAEMAVGYEAYRK